MPRPVTILALDGGGIRGIIPAKILERMEERLGEPIAEYFELITGTSTGGILALGLTVPNGANAPKFRASELVELYTTRGKDIFTEPFEKRMLDWIPPVEIDTIFDEKYAAEGLQRVLEDKFGDAMLSDAVTNVLVTAYGLESRDPWFFSAEEAAKDPGGENDHKMTFVARATSAAPTYFQPLPWHNGHPDALVDGGVFANNPTMCGWAEVASRDRSAETFVVSLGTGSKKQPYAYADAKDWGLAKWAKPILDIVFDGVSATVHYQMDKLLNRPGVPPRYYRLQPDLVDPDVGAMDDVSDEHIRKLVELADGFVEENDRKITEICTALEAFAPVRS